MRSLKNRFLWPLWARLLLEMLRFLNRFSMLLPLKVVSSLYLSQIF